MIAGGSDNLGDVRCRGCGYSLRGLRADGTCPECGRPVAFSTAPSELRYGDPAWLRRVFLGVRLMLAGWVLIGAGPLAVAYTLLALNFGWPVSESIIVPTASIVGIGLLLFLTGSFLATAPNVWIDFEARWLRKTVQAVSVASVVLAMPIALGLRASQPPMPLFFLSMAAAAALLGTMTVSFPLWIGVISTRCLDGHGLRAWRWAAFAGLIQSMLFVSIVFAVVLQSPPAAGVFTFSLLIVLPLEYVVALLALSGAARALREEVRSNRRLIRMQSRRLRHAVNRSNAS
ncbi:MAG: hypothetical protein IT450_06255 [Phycisphaerales bacterium]|nr:hypothetical protein [Phycisphaerales bacterium]